MSIAENIHQVRRRIERACERAKRNPQDVKLVAVTKTVDAARIEQAIAAGVTDIGENRVQEAWRKYQAINAPSVHWHLVGHLQTNKAKRALQFATMIHSVDSVKLARELQTQAEKLERDIDILVQVNTSGEESKFGLEPAEAEGAIAEMAGMANLKIKGLMTIGAFTENMEVVRSCFVRLRQLRHQINDASFGRVQLQELSMGMTNDFELAIEEGATLVRVGRSIFGERPQD